MSRRGGKLFLINAAFAPATQKKYRKAVDDFLSWTEREGLDSSDPFKFDEIITLYLHDMFASGDGGKGKAQDTIYGILSFLPELKGHLPMSNLALTGWKKLQPTVSYPPLTFELAAAVAVKMAFSGNWSAGVAVLLGFDCLLRIGELTSLRREDVADAKDARVSSTFRGMALRLVKTKTGPNQWVEVSDRRVQRLVRVLLTSSRGKTLFGLTAHKFRQVFKDTCADLGLSPAYVPHSLRHGGATHLHLRGVSIEDILLRGRWASTKSARRYVQSGRAMLLSMDIPPLLVPLLPFLSQRFYPLLSLAQSH